MSNSNQEDNMKWTPEFRNIVRKAFHLKTYENQPDGTPWTKEALDKTEVGPDGIIVS